MESWSPYFAYAAIFGLSLLASSVLPLGSEWLLIALLLQGFSATAVVAFATLGNTLGAITTYAVGRYGGQALAARVFGINPSELSRAHRFYTRYGVWSLLFTWLPVIGDPLCAISGFFDMHWLRFTQWVLIGKLARYAVVAWLTLTVT